MKEKDKELLQLCGKFRDEEITEEEMLRLEARLEASAADREFYLQFIQMDALLEQFPPIIEHSQNESSITKGAFGSLSPLAATGWIAAAAAFTLLAVFGIRSMHTEKVGFEDVASQSVGTLILAENCRWNTGDFTEGQRLLPSLMELREGTAVVRFDGGAEAVLTGPAGFQLSGPAAALLVHGEVVVRAEEGAEGFTLDTPSGRLIDLGTEFAVKVDGGGATELHVHEGEVALGSDFRETPGSVFKAGTAVRLEGDLENERTHLDLDAPTFQDLIDRANPRERRDLMLAYEGFDVDPGVYFPKDLLGGKGWAGPWRQRTEAEQRGHLANSSDRLLVASSQMDVVWPIKGGKLGMLEIPSGPNIWIREMRRPIRSEKWGIRYFSFLVTEPETEKEDFGAKDRQDLRFTFRSSEDYFGESLSIGWDRSLRPRVAMGNGITKRAIRTIPEGGTVFCVAKFELRKSYVDRVSFRFYTKEETLDILEPAEWDIVVADTRLNAVFDLLLLTSNAKKVRYLDEIRMGPSWRSVTPIRKKEVMMSSVESRLNDE